MRKLESLEGFDKMGSKDLEKWQTIFAEGLKLVSEERGRRKALKEFSHLQKEFKKVLAMN